MIGLRHVMAAVLFGLLVFVLARSNDLGHWCQDSKPTRPCPMVTLVDPGYLLALASLEIVGLLATMLVANLVFGLLRYRRSEG